MEKQFEKKKIVTGKSNKINLIKKKRRKKMKKKRISKKIFKVVKNRVLEKKKLKKKQNIFAEKNLEKKNILEIFFPLFSQGEGGGWIIRQICVLK